MSRSSHSAVVLAFALPLSVAAWAQAPAGQVIQKEVDVTRADGGYWVQPGQSPQQSAGQLVPPELLAPSPADYPEALRGEPIAGSVQLELLVDEAGAVQDARVLQGVHPLLDQAAVTAARKLKFKPATVNGAPLPVRIHFTYEFARPAPAAPSDARLEGLVRSKGNREPIAGATLIFDNGAPTVQTDEKGHFDAHVPPGAVGVKVSAPGYRPADFAETAQAGQTLTLIYALDPLRVNPYETIVRGERERTEVSRVTLRNQELREVPGTQGDPFRVVMLLPGVSSVASGVSYPVVRGSQPASTGYFLDGVRVPALYHLIVGSAVIHPDFIESVDFYPGPAPTQFGRLLGGAVEGHISRPREDHLHATAYADLINAGGFAEMPIAQTGTSVTIAGRVSYTPWLISRVVPITQPEGSARVNPVANFYDYQARIEQRIGPGRLRLFAFGSSDVVGADVEDPDGVDVYLYSRFHRVDLRYRQPLGPGDAEVGATFGVQGMGITGDRGEVHVGGYELTEGTLSMRASWTAQLGPQLQLAVGADAEGRRSLTNITGRDRETLATFLPPLARANFFGAYAQLVWRPSPRWTVVPGLRADSYYLIPDTSHFAVEPRLTARYALTDSVTLKGGAGLVHQPPTVLLNLPVIDTTGLRYGLQEGAQLDLGAEWKIREGFELAADAYYNPLMRAVEFDIVEALADRRRFTIPGFDPGTRGYAYGLELMLRHPLGGGWFGWVSYSFQQAARLERFSRIGNGNVLLGSTTGYVPFAFEQAHVLNAALSYKFASNLTVGVVAHFNTGRPESGEVSSRSFHEGTDADGYPVWVYDDRDRLARLPPFFRLDARISKSWAFDEFILEAYLDVLNATLSREVLGYNYTYELSGSSDPRAVTPLKTPIELPVVIPLLGIKATY